MIPNLATGTTLQGDLGGRKKQMGIDENSVAHIMSVLTDLYSDPELAVIREYSTNALDAHRDAGTTRPIEVFTPSTFSPYFRVKDYGIGLTANEIQDIYAMYGASTKRGSNDVVGMLGLGSKSGLTYTTQFTVTAVKGGVKTVVAIYKTEDGTGTSEVVDTSATAEPNGVEISIPVSSRNTFQTKAAEFFKFWAPNTVLVNGQAPKSVLDDLTEIEPGLYARKGRTNWDSGESYIVMGNVPYPIEDFHDNYLGNKTWQMRRFSMVAYVPIGSVNFTPSREALHYTELTKRTIKDAVAKWDKGLEAAAKKEILDAPTAAEAWTLWDGWRNTFGFKNLQYKGMAFVDAVPHSHTEYDVGAYRNAVGSSATFHLRILENSLFVHGFNATSVTSTNKKKIKQYLDEQNLRHEYRHIVLSPGKPTSPWLNGVKLVDFADIAAVKLPNHSTGPRGGSRKQIGYDFVTNEGGKVVDHYQKPLPAKPGKLLFYSPADKVIREHHILTGLPEHVTIVSLNTNRWDKFKRNNPGAEHVKTYARKRIAELMVVTEEYRKFKGIESSTRAFLDAVNKDEIDDPEIVEMKEFIETFKAEESDIARAGKVANGIGQYPPSVDPIPYDLTNKYPLMASARYNMRSKIRHLVLYINAVYNNSLEEN